MTHPLIQRLFDEHGFPEVTRDSHQAFISQPGVTSTGLCSDLISNGLDLLPTLCDYVGAETPVERIGRSLRPLAEGKDLPESRKYLPLESEIGRMIVTRDHKYMLYDSGDNREQLIDLREDPGETRNAIADETNVDALRTCREFFARHFDRAGP